MLERIVLERTVLDCMDHTVVAWKSCVVPTRPRDPALGAAVRQLRNDRGMTQEALAHAAGLAFGTIARLEQAKSAPDWATVRAIATALGVTMSQLGAAIDSAEAGEVRP
jgi:DNA-binding XRE family transcriptional regulator